MKTLLLFIFLAFPFAFCLAEDGKTIPLAPGEKAPAIQLFRYRVIENREKGLVGSVWIQREEHFSIPGGQSGGGGGGGVSGKTLKWVDSGKEVWIPHTPATENLENETFFTAKVTIPGKTKRIWDDQVAPQHDLIEIIPEPVKKR